MQLIITNHNSSVLIIAQRYNYCQSRNQHSTEQHVLAIYINKTTSNNKVKNVITYKLIRC